MSAMPVTSRAFADAIVEIAQQNPPLAVVLIHHHECIEDTKRAGVLTEIAVQTLSSKFSDWTNFAGVTLLGICGTLVAAVCIVAWAVVTHPHGFAQ